MQSIFVDKLPALINILKGYKVKRAYAFGSVCSGKFTPQSDIDLLIKFEEGIEPIDYSDNYFNLLFKIRDLFGREVDLVSEGALKNPYLIKSINSTRQVIYEG